MPAKCFFEGEFWEFVDEIFHFHLDIFL